MVLSKQQIDELSEAARPLIKFLSNYHPHVKVIVDVTHAEMVEGIATFRTEDYLKD